MLRIPYNVSVRVLLAMLLCGGPSSSIAAPQSPKRHGEASSSVAATNTTHASDDATDEKSPRVSRSASERPTAVAHESASWWDPYTTEFIVLPLLTQNPDAGPTALGAASFYLHDGQTHPYKLWASGVASVSWAGVVSAVGYLEVVRPWSVPVRLLWSAGYQSTIAGHYCGIGNQVTCDVNEAAAEAANATENPAEQEEFIRRRWSLIRLRFTNRRISVRFASSARTSALARIPELTPVALLKIPRLSEKIAGFRLMPASCEIRKSGVAFVFTQG